MLLPTDHAQHHQHPSQKIQLIRKTLKTEHHPNSMKNDNCPYEGHGNLSIIPCKKEGCRCSPIMK